MHKVLAGNKWMELRETECGYTYCHSLHGKGQGVAVLVYKRSENAFVGRFEITPSHSPEVKLASLTGGVENGDPLLTAVTELWEEAGIRVDNILDIVSLGKVFYSKNSDTVVHLFCLEWEGEIMTNPPGDGSDGEKTAHVEWVTDADILKSSDPLLITMLARLQNLTDLGYK